MLDRNRLETLDGLRGIAVLGVFLFHLSHRVSRQHFFWFWPDVCYSGLYAVQLFFCVSGFLVFHSFQKYQDGQNWKAATRAFFVSRAFRILPLWWLAVLLSWAILHFDTRVLLLNLSFLFGFFAADAHFTPLVVSWSLFVEVVFYLLVPLVVLFLKTSLMRAGIFFLGSVILAIIWLEFATTLGAPTTENFLERSPIYHLQFFALGIFTHQLWRSTQIPAFTAQLKLAGRTLTSPVVVVALGSLFYVQFVMTRSTAFLLVILGLWMFLALSKASMWRLNPLRWKALGALGRMCYSFYLSHLFIFDGLEGTRRALFKNLGIFGRPSELQILIWGPILLLICGGISWIFYRFVERPVIRFGQNLFGLGEHFPASKLLDKGSKNGEHQTISK